MASGVVKSNWVNKNGNVGNNGASVTVLLKKTPAPKLLMVSSYRYANVYVVRYENDNGIFIHPIFSMTNLWAVTASNGQLTIKNDDAVGGWYTLLEP